MKRMKMKAAGIDGILHRNMEKGYGTGWIC